MMKKNSRSETEFLLKETNHSRILRILLKTQVKLEVPRDTRSIKDDRKVK